MMFEYFYDIWFLLMFVVLIVMLVFGFVGCLVCDCFLVVLLVEWGEFLVLVLFDLFFECV